MSAPIDAREYSETSFLLPATIGKRARRPFSRATDSSWLYALLDAQHKFLGIVGADSVNSRDFATTYPQGRWLLWLHSGELHTTWGYNPTNGTLTCFYSAARPPQIPDQATAAAAAEGITIFTQNNTKYVLVSYSTRHPILGETLLVPLPTKRSFVRRMRENASVLDGAIGRIGVSNAVRYIEELQGELQQAVRACTTFAVIFTPAP